jgi:hypothetical protein
MLLSSTGGTERLVLPGKTHKDVISAQVRLSLGLLEPFRSYSFLMDLLYSLIWQSPCSLNHYEWVPSMDNIMGDTAQFKPYPRLSMKYPPMTHSSICCLLIASRGNRMLSLMQILELITKLGFAIHRNV